MKALNILIVEDETITAMDIQQTLEAAGHRITAVAHTFDEAISAIQVHPPDLSLIDIRLEGSSADGITTARQLLTYHRMPIIYLTASSEHETVQAAMQTLPIAYLLKPFRHDELSLQVEIAYHYFKNSGSASHESTKPGYLYWPVGEGYDKVDPENVLYLQADGAYAKAYLVGTEQPYHISTNLKHMAQYFTSPNFYRLSRSILINLRYLERLEPDYLYLATHKIPIQIPKASRKELLKRLTIVKTR